ncbi:hypothetical protein ABIE64_000476 [Thalassospira sp. MBR-102]
MTGFDSVKMRFGEKLPNNGILATIAKNGNRYDHPITHDD